MPISISNQAYIFLYSIVGGMLIAFIYDVFRIQRKAVKTASIVIHIEDFIYWIIVTAVMFGTVYYLNEGEVRGYIFIGAVFGVIFYSSLFSKFVIKSSLIVIRAAYRVLTIIWKIVSFPFRLIFKILSYPYNFILFLSGKILRKALKISKTRMTFFIVWRRVFKNIRKKI